MLGLGKFTKTLLWGGVGGAILGLARSEHRVSLVRPCCCYGNTIEVKTPVFALEIDFVPSMILTDNICYFATWEY